MMNFFLGIILASFSPALGANILIFSGHGKGSHFFASAYIGNEMFSRGHNVTALISTAYLEVSYDERFKDINFEIFTHKDGLRVVLDRDERTVKKAFEGSHVLDLVFNISHFANEQVVDCQSIFEDDALVRRLDSYDFELAIIDPFWPCSLVVAERFARRHVSTMPTSWWNMMARLVDNGINPTHYPEMSTGLSLRMTFLERIKSLISASTTFVIIWATDQLTPLMHKHDVLPDLKASDIFRRSELLIANSDNAVEFPVATYPHVILAGGLTTQPAQQLSSELEEYVQSSGDDGLIIFSLGTYVTYMKEELIAVFADAFAQLPQKVLWQFRGTPPALLTDIPNIKTMPWLPQNDLLGHNKTRVFMYQGGNNGLYEALYHAVPLVVIPLIGDQPDVAARVTTRGMGLSIDIKTITTQKIVDTLNTVMHEKQYKETAKRLSAIFHDRPMRPVEKAAFWIEHVMKHGGEYMRSPIHDLTWYQYYLIDVVAFLLLVAVVVIAVIFYSCKFTFRCCKRICGGKKTKTD